MNTLMVTGHRPNKLFGYNLQTPAYRKMLIDFRDFIVSQDVEEVITGMALGVDTVMALAVLSLKDEGVNVRLHCAIPCRNHDSQWFDESRKLYKDILSQADKVVLVTDSPYSPALMQRRNEYMVDNADICLAVWDGSSGGTGNCVRYIKSKQKKCFVVSPSKYR